MGKGVMEASRDTDGRK